MGIAANLSKMELMSGVVATGATAGIMSVKNRDHGNMGDSSLTQCQKESVATFSVDRTLANNYLQKSV